MLPDSCARIWGSSRRVAWKAADRLTASAASQFATGKSSIGAKWRTTALLMRMSTAPKRVFAAAISAATSDGSERSASTYSTRTSCSRAMARRVVSISAAGASPLSMTSAPAPASACAIAAPRPPVDPVTNALRPRSGRFSAMTLTLEVDIPGFRTHRGTNRGNHAANAQQRRRRERRRHRVSEPVDVKRIERRDDDRQAEADAESGGAHLGDEALVDVGNEYPPGRRDQDRQQAHQQDDDRE